MVESIGIAELLARADAGKPLLLLDVRNAEDFAAWRFEARSPVETVHVPYFDFIEDEVGSLARVPERDELVVLCAKGGSSAMVAGMLEGSGRRAVNVSGGMIAYGEYLQAVPVPAEAGQTFDIRQLNRRGKGCLSYLVRAGDEAVVVDPSRSVATYAELAARLGCRIVRVLDTHVHADHVSGGPDLAVLVGADYSVDAGPGSLLGHPVRPFADGDSIQVGREGARVEIRAIAAPGHTPGSTLFLVGKRHLLSGDTLFASGVGRPDLGGEVVAWGRALFRTLRERIAGLPDATVVLPAHYASTSEIGPDGVVSGRLGDLRRDLPEMKMADERSFVEAMRAAVRDPPAAYQRIVRANLGEVSASVDEITEWELGRNQCAASVQAAARPGA